MKSICRRTFQFRSITILVGLLSRLAISSTTFAQLVEDDNGPPPVRDLSAVRMTPVTGRVLDANGTPVERAQIAIVVSEYARSARPKGVSLGSYVGGETLPRSFDLMGPVATDSHGHFELPVPESQTGVYSGLEIYATAEEHGCAIKDLGQTAGRQLLELKLGPEHVIRGRVIDLNGQPAAGVQVFPVFHGTRGSGPLSVRRPWRQPLEIWKPVTTDDKGRFLIRGLCPEAVGLHIEGAQFTPLRTHTKPVPIKSDETAIFSLAPAKRIHGHVTFADSGMPASNVRIVSPTIPAGHGDWIEARTDSNGDYSITPYAAKEKPQINWPKRCKLNVFPPDGQNYLVAELIVSDFRGASQQVDIKLERGVLVSGRVTESPSGKGINGARIQFIHKTQKEDVDYASAESLGLQTAITNGDGTYQLAIPRRLGHLMVLGPTLDYLRVETSNQEIHQDGRRGKHRWSANAIARLDFKPETTEHHLDFSLRKGVRFKAHVVDPEDKPVDEFVICSGAYVAPGYQYSHSSPGNWRDGRDGEFELPGLDPDQKQIIHVYDRKHGLGTTIEFSGTQESQPILVRLQPCGSAKARFVDADGNPLPKHHPQISCMLTDGVPHRVYGGRDDYDPEADVIRFYKLEPNLPEDDGRVDSEGRIRCSSLIPGARYMIDWAPPSGDWGQNAPWPHLIFTVNAGENKDLGDIIVKGKGAP